MNTSFPDETEDQEEEPEFLQHRYRIDPSVQENGGRSFLFMLKQRMSPESLKRLGEQPEKQVPVEDGASGRVRFRRQKSDTTNDPISLIQQYSANTPNYNDPRLPLKEVLFRILLARGNEPKTVAQLYQDVKDWVGIGDTRAISHRSIARILEYDDFYGFFRVEQG